MFRPLFRPMVAGFLFGLSSVGLAVPLPSGLGSTGEKQKSPSPASEQHPESPEESVPLPQYYGEMTRPQFHFTPYAHQMNDPNGLIYDEETGEYHLFFQCNRPFDTGVPGLCGTTSWGHAVSTDLVTWNERPLAVKPDRYGAAWSGSAVIDRHNTSKLFCDDTENPDYTPPGSRIVMFYASVGGDQTYGNAKESLVYSPDGGRTFLKYKGNPVLKNPGNRYGGGLRDPKVFWFEDDRLTNGGIWVMVTVGYPHMFTSPNLIDWQHCGRLKLRDGSDFDSECPDLYPLPVDGNPDNIRWVYSGGGLFYMLGHMEVTGGDRVLFVPDTDQIVPVNGIADQIPGQKAPEIYATQSFGSEKYGRRVSISWIRDPMGNWKDKIWNSAQSIPVEERLCTVNGKIKLFHRPVGEIDRVRGRVLLSMQDVRLDETSENPLKDIHVTSCDLTASVTLGTATEVGFRLRTGEKDGQKQELLVRFSEKDGKLYVDKTKTGPGFIGVYEPELTLPDNRTLTFRILLDRICFDICGNDGETFVSGILYSEWENDGMAFFTNGTVTVRELNIYSINPTHRLPPEIDPV